MVDFNSEILWHDIGPALDEITLKGLLDEGGSRTLLMERVFATALQYHDEIIQLADFKSSGSYEPVSLDGLRYWLLYKRARRIIERRMLHSKLRRGEINLVSHEGGIYYSAGLDDRESSSLDKSAWRIASRAKFFRHPEKLNPGFNDDYMESRLHGDIGLLESMGLGELEPPIQMSFTDYQSLLNSQGDVPTGLALLGNLYKKFLDAYKMLVEGSLPTLRDYLPLYRSMPLTCFLRLETFRGELKNCPRVLCRPTSEYQQRDSLLQ